MAGKSGNGGYIKIDRNILNWEWYDDVSTKVLFLHCILRANWKDHDFRGMKIQRGQFVTSLSNLAKETGLTIRQTRTALSHLESTGELTNLSTPNFRIITVNNYDLYQDVTKRTTNKRQTNDKRIDNQNDNNRRIYKEDTTYLKEKKEGGCAAHCPSGEDEDTFPYDEGNLTDAYYAERGI